MPDETTGLPDVPAEGEEPKEVHAVLMVGVHFHAENMLLADSFGKRLQKELTDLANQRVNETEGVWIPDEYGLKPGEGELSEEDITRLLGGSEGAGQDEA